MKYIRSPAGHQLLFACETQFWNVNQEEQAYTPLQMRSPKPAVIYGKLVPYMVFWEAGTVQ
jgi:hypothetical protein